MKKRFDWKQYFQSDLFKSNNDNINNRDESFSESTKNFVNPKKNFFHLPRMKNIYNNELIDNNIKIINNKKKYKKENNILIDNNFKNNYIRNFYLTNYNNDIEFTSSQKISKKKYNDIFQELFKEKKIINDRYFDNNENNNIDNKNKNINKEYVRLNLSKLKVLT